MILWSKILASYDQEYENVLNHKIEILKSKTLKKLTSFTSKYITAMFVKSLFISDNVSFIVYASFESN